MSRASERKPVMVKDHTRGAIHMKACPLLLTLHEHDTRPCVGLEHELVDGTAAFCTCTAAFLLRSVAGMISGVASGKNAGKLLAHARGLRRNADVIEQHMEAIVLSCEANSDGQQKN